MTYPPQQPGQYGQPGPYGQQGPYGQPGGYAQGPPQQPVPGQPPQYGHPDPYGQYPGQPPAPGYAPYGQPGYPTGPGGPGGEPPKKKTGLIIGLVIAGVVLVGGGIALVLLLTGDERALVRPARAQLVRRTAPSGQRHRRGGRAR
ncbi:hypothetical protein [Amycolatopsis palatopharyngis]|uniref:hypothetical protein n=1 Tax=Amycolatopsis palatopharyngis TaxID=187982 RepID=UPI000E27EAEB|nr:hypothetical protein [Amycolatopsis palatopharyngis]